jgi:hypothetical protein
MPPAIDFQADAGGGAPGGVSYDQMGTPRASGSEAGAAQTTENLQTVGAQWFMDHSADIAAAVRNAMLNLSSINDVVNGL